MFSLFSLFLEHGYFAGKKWSNAQLQATSTTQFWLNRYQMSLHKDGTTWRLYGYQNTSKTDFLHFLRNSQNIQTLEFWLLQPLSDFVTFTDLPMDWKGLLQFNSANSTPVSEGKGVSLLQVNTLYEATQDVFVDRAIAKIVFNINDLMTTESYQIVLSARETQWVYHLIQRGQTHLYHPQLVDKKNEVSFSTPSSYKTQDGETAWLSNSGEFNLPLQQVPEPRFELVDTQKLDSTGEHYIKRTVISALPAPRSDQLHFGVPMNSNESFPVCIQSHMYVYF
ncbi:hypothetical protein [Pseudoalteromonas byunsanensis]|uniref:Uncharacterized protein n=1 Tax=Pseudoalteromonas byunsanensis TaxID=327939 RepID=A0A1S1MXB2_9GAMM|nr:hypothetical protein [Pseudoalteromonas byunsanensis]OHU93552.1 hypothetical protein BIW53_19605 [Pseudoalteromonas byunsanensis]